VTETMVWPCCKTPLPAPLDGVGKAICGCGQEWSPERIIEYNEMIKKPEVK